MTGWIIEEYLNYKGVFGGVLFVGYPGRSIVDERCGGGRIMAVNESSGEMRNERRVRAGSRDGGCWVSVGIKRSAVGGTD